MGAAEDCGEDFQKENPGLMSGSSETRIREILKLRGGGQSSYFQNQYGPQTIFSEKFLQILSEMVLYVVPEQRTYIFPVPTISREDLLSRFPGISHVAVW